MSISNENKFYHHTIFKVFQDELTIVIHNGDPSNTRITKRCAICCIFENDIEVTVIFKLIVIDDVNSNALSILCVLKGLK